MNILNLILLSLLGIFLLYVVIETAVRRGIDASKTHQLLKEILEKNEK